MPTGLGEIPVVFYARVSTEHEEQENAFEQQIMWYEDLLMRYPQWKKIRLYTDKGITGTEAHCRPGFMQMMKDAGKGEFRLIVTREVCRFARNTVDTLQYTRKLRELNVEVFFVNDNIWSWAQDGELRLTLMAALAQEEARKISERVRSGQEISRKKGILFGNGNVIGYDLVKGDTSAETTYVINPEQARIVKTIFFLYVYKGYGMRRIATELHKLGYKNTKGEVKWCVRGVQRIIQNKLYCGYIGYKKQRVISYLGHKRENTTDRSKIEYIKGNFQPIITERLWNRAQEICASKRHYAESFNAGLHKSEDVFAKKLKCSCGSTFKRYKWRTNKNKNVEYGYRCNSQVRYTRKEFREKYGLSTAGFCDIPSVCKWKLDLMMRVIVQMIWKDPDQTVLRLQKCIERLFVDEKNEMDPVVIERDNLDRRLEQAQKRQDQLIIMRADQLIADDKYIEMAAKIEKELLDIRERLAEIDEKTPEKDTDKERVFHLNEINQKLQFFSDIEHFSDDRMVDSFVDKVVVCENRKFLWYLNLTGDDTSDNPDYSSVMTFKIGFDQARKYRKDHGSFLRESQWEDLTVEILMKL